MKSHTVYRPAGVLEDDFPRYEVKHTEQGPDLFTVGYVGRAGAWSAESDHQQLGEAQKECDRQQSTL